MQSVSIQPIGYMYFLSLVYMFILDSYMGELLRLLRRMPRPLCVMQTLLWMHGCRLCVSFQNARDAPRCLRPSIHYPDACGLRHRADAQFCPRRCPEFWTQSIPFCPARP